MKRYDDPLDRKALIFEAYRIDGIKADECRSIFLDWAMSLPDGQDTQAAITHYLERYGADFPDHPMTQVLQQGQEAAMQPRRRGGWKSRPRD
ncbi:hypothetical protein DC366_00450 [Pelagivirga sediminicola]|uniref:Uncharacterized protein n=1 Tax=Pelagivirga sediminicola TaxID=2170575 RepID=A0A2T7GAQ9_9RHOB|nr:hypothetical protein [Pelagivirga sediminicola]PVA11486.1 hypothetical protein DC366_00450 [Pelagivirga sediminicola]